MNGEEFTRGCKECVHREYCMIHGEPAVSEDECLGFEPQDSWDEMSYYRLRPKTIQQRLREGE